MNKNCQEFNFEINETNKSELYRCESFVVWLTGLPGAGKSTTANQIEKKLFERALPTAILDGDTLRAGLCCDLGFDDKDRTENIRRAAEVAKLFKRNGIITVCAFISPSYEQRCLAREIIGTKSFIECFVNTPLNICIERDEKGTYAKYETPNSLQYQSPVSPELVLNTQSLTPNQCADLVIKYLEERLFLKV